MPKLMVSEWMTLDGVYDADTMKTWFEPFESAERASYIKDRLFSADAMLLGRVTYEMFASYWPNMKKNEFGIADRLNSMPKYVVSSTLAKADWNNSTIIKDHVQERVLELKQQAGQGIIVYGSGTLVQTLLEANLVDEAWFLVHPFLMGSGKRAFKDGLPQTRLRLAKTKTLEAGVMMLRYDLSPTSKG